MTAQELKDRLSDDDIKELLNKLGAEISYEDDEYWISNTICHHGNKHKLYYYKDSKAFHCYTQCGQMDIIGLVMESKEFDDFPKAINWICVQLNINARRGGFNFNQEQISDWEFISKYKKKSKRRRVTLEPLEIYDDKILNIFLPLYTKAWIDDGISIETMRKYEIMYCMLRHKIIIPHRDMRNNLIGIRARATIEDEIEEYGKYAPYRSSDNMIYNHPLGRNLYGLNKNIKAIQKKRKIMLVEAEKSVLQCDTMFGDESFTVSLCGCNLTEYQKAIILLLGVREVIIALDKQYETVDSEEYYKWVKHIKENIIDKLSPYVKVTVLWDVADLLPYKASPTDRGKEILLKLMDNKICVSTNE